jgi:hypothetical protein
MSFNFLTTIENIIETTETDVLAMIAKIKTGAAIAEADIQSGLKWVAANAPQIAADVQQVEAVVTAVGFSNPAVAAAITAANVAVAGINAVAQAETAGQTTAQTLVAGYAAVKSATSAAAQAGVALAKA